MFYIGSVLLSLCVVQVVMAVVLLAFWRMRLNANGLLEMALAMAISSVGALLTAVGTSTANLTLAFMGIQGFVVGVLLAARSMRRLQNYAPLVGLESAVVVVCLVGDAYFFFVADKFAGALALNSMAYTVVCSITAWHLFQENRRDLKTGCRVLGAIFGAFAVASVIRAVVRLYAETPRPTTLEAVSVDLVYAFIAIAVSIGWSLAFVWTSYSVAAHRLRAANEKLDRFSGAVAHDLNTPLNAVIGYLGAIKHLPDDAHQHRAAFVATAEEAASRMNRFIHHLLEESRAGHGAPEPVPVDVQKCIADALHPLGPKINAAGADIELGETHDVVANAFQLTRVFQNILDNAIKYRSDDHPLRIRISSKSAGGWVDVAVADNGLGIAKAEQANIFKRFRRADDTTPVPGYGLGLSECQRIVESYGGTINVESAPGEGTTFTVRLPSA